MKKMIIPIFFWLLFTCCVKKRFYPDITFVKLGPAEIKSKYDSLILGSSFFLQTDFQQDSIYIKINVQPDDLDSIDLRMPITLKAKTVEDLKNACTSFIKYSKILPNGNLPNSYFNEPPIYNGGTYFISYVDSTGVEHYFCYVLKDLSYETRQLHKIFMDYCHEVGLSKSYERKFRINSDSIARTISSKINMKFTSPIVPRVKPPPMLEFKSKKK